jgi:O-antigen ligase
MRTLALALSLLVIFTIPWEGAILVGDWGTLSRFLGVLLAGAWLASSLIRRQFRAPHPFHLAIVVFVLWNAASLFWTFSNDETIKHIKTYTQLALLSWIIWDLYVTPGALRTALQVYVLGAYVTIGATLYNFVLGREIAPYSGGRYSGAGLNAIEVALILTLGLPIAWHLAVFPAAGSKRHFLTLLNYAFIPASLFAMTLTASRTFLIAVIPCIFYVILAGGRFRLRSRILGLAVLALITIVLLAYAPRSAIERLATIGDSVSSMDFGGRGALWSRTASIIAKHPILGIGSGAVESAAAAVGGMAHNTFISITAELGLVGILIFCCILAIVVHQAFVQTRDLSRLWITVLAILLIGCSSLTWEYTKQTWLFLSLVVISANASENSELFARSEPRFYVARYLSNR